MQQNDDEIDEYLVRIQTKSKICDFNANKEERILEQIIKGMKNSELRRNLISKQNLTLIIAIESVAKGILVWRGISPNQDDISYSPNHLSGQQ